MGMKRELAMVGHSSAETPVCSSADFENTLVFESMPILSKINLYSPVLECGVAQEGGEECGCGH